MVNIRSANSWVTIPGANSSSSLRLFCFHYAGSNASIFRTWSNRLGTEIEVCPVHLPGRERRWNEPLITQIVPLVEALADALYPHLLDRPFAFFGHSMGALISFELARELRRQHAPSPVHLFVSGRQAPQLGAIAPPIHQLPEAEFIEALRRYQGTPDAVLRNAEIMQMLMPILRADFSVCETYVYANEEPLNCPISAFGGLQDDHANSESLVGWQSQTHSSFKLQMFAGNHFFLHDASELLLQSITQELTQSLK
jgi:medium-chain acyl-[acyl-carrier-protein] hydrolase